jgi:hypothetical protein
VTDTTRDRQREATRQRLYEAALGIFRRDGFRDARVDDITLVAGVTGVPSTVAAVQLSTSSPENVVPLVIVLFVAHSYQLGVDDSARAAAAS